MVPLPFPSGRVVSVGRFGDWLFLSDPPLGSGLGVGVGVGWLPLDSPCEPLSPGRSGWFGSFGVVPESPEPSWLSGLAGVFGSVGSPVWPWEVPFWLCCCVGSFWFCAPEPEPVPLPVPFGLTGSASPAESEMLPGW